MKNEDKTGKESLTSFVNQGNSFCLSEPQLPLLYTGGKNITTRMFSGGLEMKCAQGLAEEGAPFIHMNGMNG